MSSQFVKIQRLLWIVLLCVGLTSGYVMAASTPISAPMVPAQGPGAIAPVEPEQTSDLKVEVQDVQGQVSVKKGDVLHEGDTVKTQAGTCHLLIDGKAELFLAPGTTLEITEALRNNAEQTDSTRLTVEFGKIKVKLPKLENGSTFEVASPTAIATVRGTTFFLNVGNVSGQASAQLYVDETHGGVLFKNVATGRSFLVPAFSLSSAFADGRLNEPRELTPEQRDLFIKNWESPSSGSQQFGVEEEPLPPATPPLTPPLDDLGFKEDDAKQDKNADRLIPGANGFDLPTLPPVLPITPKEPPDGLDEQERAMIRQEIGRIRNDQDFDHADANLARISDAQTGKVFTDVFGNRVRVDQYIFHEADSDTVQVLSLTARTGQEQHGVSSVLFGTQFNRSIGSDVTLSQLPWDDYMRVVRREDVAANLGLQSGTEEYNALFDEYIIHEHAPELAQGPSALYPQHFFAQFTNPSGERGGSDLVRFDDFFTSPFSLDLQTGDGLQSFIAQGKALDFMLVQPFSGESVLLINTFGGGEFIAVGTQDPQPFFGGQSNGNGDGTQTATFAANFDPSKLRDINFYRNLPVNNDGSPNNDEHPAYFDNRLNDRLDVSQAVIGRNHLIGGFIPINDQGKIIDQPGFKVRGLRDLMSPNPLVDGGNYNLEVILMYGYVDGQDNPQSGLFHEDFRIDLILTPEIFQSFGSPKGSALFPPALYPDEDDNPNTSAV